MSLPALSNKNDIVHFHYCLVKDKVDRAGGRGKRGGSGGVYGGQSLVISPPIRLVPVQPSENDLKMKPKDSIKTGRDCLKKVDISPDLSSLEISGRERDRAGRRELRPHRPSVYFSQLPPPPLPEPAPVDKERVLREVLSGHQEKLERPINQPTSDGENVEFPPPKEETELEEVSLDTEDSTSQASSTSSAFSQTGGLQQLQQSGQQAKRRPSPAERERLVQLFEQLLSDIYPPLSRRDEIRLTRRASDFRLTYESRTRLPRHQSHCGLLENWTKVEALQERHQTEDTKDLSKEEAWELRLLIEELKLQVQTKGDALLTGLEDRDRLRTEHQGLCDLLTAVLQAISNKTSEDTEVRFSVSPGSGDSGFSEWCKAMKMVARLPEGVPAHFRKTLWLSLAEKHLAARSISWPQVERSIFSDRLNPDDQELSVQIVKDLHRTGCSLFCGASGQHNQAVLKRVLLAYARWNKTVGYCQGLNMLAALILQVMQGCQGATVKVMIYLIEGVLPESYFADNLRGLSVDMAVFRDLLSLKLPELSRHLDNLQQDSKESGTSYEPPLMDVFTMQWFLTIFCNCLPQPTVLRLWDLLFLEGDSVLIKAALVIWQNLSERMLSVRSADEFYSIMAVLTREMMEFGLMDANSIIRAMDLLSIPELSELRDRYVYNISPWPVAAKKGLRIFYPQQGNNGAGDEGRTGEPRMTPISNHPDREKIALDITALKKQYWKLRERQRQAHIILSAACGNDSYRGGNSPALNHLLLGKSALRSVKARTRPGMENLHPSASSGEGGVGRRGSDVTSRRPELRRKLSTSSSSSSSSTELCDSSGDSGGEDSPLHSSPTLKGVERSVSPSGERLSPSPSAPSSQPPEPCVSPSSRSSSPPRPSMSPLPRTSSPPQSSRSPLPRTSSPPRSSMSPLLRTSSPPRSSMSPLPRLSSPPRSSRSPSPQVARPSSPMHLPSPPGSSSPTSTTLPAASPPTITSRTSPPPLLLSPPSRPMSSSPSTSYAAASPCSSYSSVTASIPSPPLSPPRLSEDLLDEAARKRDELMRILQENSEMLGRFRHHSTSPTSEDSTALNRHRHISPEEPEDIKDIRRRYSVDPFPPRGAPKPREVGVKLGLYSQPS